MGVERNEPDCSEKSEQASREKIESIVDCQSDGFLSPDDMAESFEVEIYK